MINDFEMNDFQLEIMKQRYALPTEKTWADVSKRVSGHLSKAENNGDMSVWEKRFNWAMVNGYFFPGGRVLYGSGRRIGGLLNCFCKGVEDNRHSIAKLAHDMYLISTFGGGVGTNYSAIRPKGDPIQGVQGSAPGVVSEIRKIDAIGEQVKSGGGRRVALIATLSIDHPDLLDFLDVKLDLGQLNNHNISINYSEKFFDAVRDDKDWVFDFRGITYHRFRLEGTIPGDGQHSHQIFVVAPTPEAAIETAKNYHRNLWTEQFEVVAVEDIKARDLWGRICKNAVESGEPGFLFEDNIKSKFATHYFEEYSNCNPCLAGDTKILTTKGEYEISKLTEMYLRGETLPNVYSISEDGCGSLVDDVPLFSQLTKRSGNVIELEMDDESIITLTPDHMVNTLNRGWVSASQLDENDEIVSINYSISNI